MKCSTIAFLFGWLFPTKQIRDEFRAFCKNAEAKEESKILRKRYEKLQKSKNFKDKKVKVLFLVNEVSKWKAQSLYDELEKNEKFEPVVALTIADIQTKLEQNEKEKILNENFEFFNQKGMRVVSAYKAGKPLSLKIFKPDVVFYQQPYNIPKVQDFEAVSKYAFTCYIPYFVSNYGLLAMDCGYEFHKKLFRHYVLNEELAEKYRAYMQVYAGDVKACGHTVLDSIKQKSDRNEGYIIYAPHWSIPHEKNHNRENFSTFLQNGHFILEYAKAHPEQKWAFKPHPTLKYTLIKTGVMNEQDIENYYKEWEQLGIVCNSGDYVDLFAKSKALVTDCASFLIEYFVTGKPVIRLVSAKSKVKATEFSQKIFNTFYNIKNNDELVNVFKNVLEENNDYLKAKRLCALEETGLLNGNASENIRKDMENFLNI